MGAKVKMKSRRISNIQKDSRVVGKRETGGCFLGGRIRTGGEGLSRTDGD